MSLSLCFYFITCMVVNTRCFFYNSKFKYSDAAPCIAQASAPFAGLPDNQLRFNENFVLRNLCIGVLDQL